MKCVPLIVYILMEHNTIDKLIRYLNNLFKRSDFADQEVFCII